MVWLVNVGLEGGFDASSVTGCPNRRLRTNATTAHPTGESTGARGWSVANGPSPNDANTPCIRSRVIDGAVDSGPAAEMVCLATRSICGGEIVAIACFSACIRVTGAMLESETAAAGALTTLCALTRIEAAGGDASLLLVGVFPAATGELLMDEDDGFRAAGGDASLLLVGVFPAATGELLMDEDDGFRAAGGTLVSVEVGCASGCAVPVAGATAVTSSAAVIALNCAPPLLCASPLRGSSVAVDPIEVVPVMLVALFVDEVELDPPTEVALDGGASDSAGLVDGDVDPVGGIVEVDDVLSVEGVLPVDDVEEESVVDEPGSVGSAHATPGVAATATPTPKATANAPTRPIYAAYPITTPPAVPHTTANQQRCIRSRH
jgi:hypothetical protein